MSNKTSDQSQNPPPDDLSDQEVKRLSETITEEDIQAAAKTILNERKNWVIKELGQEFTERIYNKCDLLLQDAIWRIIRALDTIPEPVVGKRGNRPMMNIQTMQIWLRVQLSHLEHLELPIQSTTGESILKKLSSQTLTIGGKKVCWSEENWKRIFKNANKLVNNHEELKNATSLIIDKIKTDNTIVRLSSPDRLSYLKNQRKQLRRKYRKKAQPLLDEIRETEVKLIAESRFEDWLETNINAEYEKIKKQLKKILG